MPFVIIRNDLANVTADAIVNTANPSPIVGAGTDTAIHKKAGPALLEARKKIGHIPVGHCAVTPAFGLNAKYVIHTVGPIWRGGSENEAKLLESCFLSSLKLAADYGCSSIAFPLISTGAYGYPAHEALQIAIEVFSCFLLTHEMDITLVVWDKNAFSLSKGLFHNVQSYINEHYIEEMRQVYSNSSDSFERRRLLQNRPTYSLPPTPPSTKPALPSVAPSHKAKGRDQAFSSIPPAECLPYDYSVSAAVFDSASTLDELLEKTDAGFSETLLKLIDETGKKDSEIYKKANVSKQHFSKIRNNPDYKPTKTTALAFAIALELDLPQTRDLIGRAGYALTNSSKFDVIIMYFISKKNYNMFDINMTLFQFDQMTLGV